MKKILGLLAGLLLITVNLYAGSGDLIVDGNLGVGTTTTPTAKLEVNGNISTGGDKIELSYGKTGNHYSYIDLRGDDTYADYGLRLLRGNTGADTWSELSSRGVGGLYLQTIDVAPIVMRTASVDRVRLTGAGTFNVFGPTYNTDGIWHTSDEKFKKNILSIDDSLGKISKLSGVSYEWKVDEYKEKNFSTGKQFGLIAQDVERVLPEVVRADEDGSKAIAYTQIIPLLIEAIKAQQAEIEELKKMLK